MERINTIVDAKRFDELVHGTQSDPVLPQYGSPGYAAMEIAAKPHAMESGKAAIVISFHVVLPDGRRQRVQATTSRAAFLAAADVLRAHPDLS